MPECEERANKGLGGLLELDAHNLELLWWRTLRTEYGGTTEDSIAAGRYRSGAEARLGHQLYLVAVLLERVEEDVWRAGSQGSGDE